MEVTNALHDAESLFFNGKDEEDYFFSFLKPDDVCLEYGAGHSTKAIAARVKEIYSIEHNEKWYNKIIGEMPENACLLYVAHDQEEGVGMDGSYEEYKTYVDFPEKIGVKFNVVLVDGRARVACARAAIRWLAEDGIIFIHDIFNPNKSCDRPEYYEVLDFLDHIGQVYALGAFKPKKNI